ncbi:MAG: PEP-CTERM sorting domain-containing protein [Steroidobacteraceae bacterium]
MVNAFAFTVVAALALGFLPQARAGAISYTLNTYYGTTPASTGSYGTVLLTQDGSNVDVSVSLATGVGFVDTGAGDSLMWDLNSSVSSPINLTGLTPGFLVRGGSLSSGTWTVSSVTNGFNGNASGDWNFAVTCAGGACGKGGSSPAITPPALSFTIDNIGLSDFITNGDGNYFASDVCVKVISGDSCAAGSNTGVISGGPSSSVPEPGALALFAAGLGALGFALSYKRRRAARQR